MKSKLPKNEVRDRVRKDILALGIDAARDVIAQLERDIVSLELPAPENPNISVRFKLYV